MPRAGSGISRSATPSSGRLFLCRRDARLRGAVGETLALRDQRSGLTAGGGTHAAFGQRSIPAKQPVVEPARRSASDPSRPNSRWWNPRGVRPAIHPGQTASLRAAHRCVSVEIHSVFLPHAPCQPGASPASALTRIPPPAISPRRCAPLIVAFRSKYTRYSSLTRLVSRAPRRPRRSLGFHHRLFHRVAARRSSLRFGRNTPGIPPSRALSAGRLAPTGRTGRPRRSPGFHHRL